VLHHVLIILFVQEAGEGGEAAHRQQLHITCIAVAALLIMLAAVYQLLLFALIINHEIDQVAAMWLDVPGLIAEGRGVDGVRVEYVGTGNLRQHEFVWNACL